jgi:molybdate transport system substrate-binding protein
MRTKAALLLATLAGAVSLAGPAAAADPAVVSAAASLRDAFAQIGALTAAGPTPPLFHFGASGDLVAQIRAGAPVDVFASAAHEEMDDLESAGLILPQSRAEFAANEIVLIVPVSAGAAVSSFPDLGSPAVARIGVGNAATVPAGRYAAEVFVSAGLSPALQGKLVPGESVRQVLDWVARGEVDAGVVYATDAMTRPGQVRIVAAAPPGSHRPIRYPIAILRAAAHPRAAQSFLDAVRSPAGQAILARFGFTAVPGRR